MIAAEKLGHVDQVVLATRRPAIDVRVFRGIDLRLYPERGLDVGAAWFGGCPLAWISPAGEGGADSEDWRTAWGGGLVTTCGLDNVGAASEGIGLHGTYTFLEARDVRISRSTEEVAVRGSVRDPRGLTVERTIRTFVGEGRVELVDRTSNAAGEPVAAPVLYHVNLGWPLWDEAARVETDADVVVPRDEDARGGPWRETGRSGDGPERVYEHVGAAEARVTNPEAGLSVTVRSDLPRLWQWIDPRLHALGIEPANCSVLGRAHDRAEGRLPVLRPGETRKARITITAEVT